MSDYARRVILNLDTSEITIGGETFPWFFSGAEPTVIKGERGELLPGLTLTIACADLTVISPGKMING
jgi:hypothetical protein